MSRSTPRRIFLGRPLLAALFLLFCYALLSWRAVMLNEAAPLFSERRLLALMVGAGLFWLALKQIDTVTRFTVARVASWVVGATLVVFLARLAVDWWRPDDVLTPAYALRWSLAWSGYFGLWLMGALVFRRSVAAPVQSVVRESAPVTADQAAWLLDILVPQLEHLSPAQRHLVAHRLVAQAGAYELTDKLDSPEEHNARLALAREVAERLQTKI